MNSFFGGLIIVSGLLFLGLGLITFVFYKFDLLLPKNKAAVKLFIITAPTPISSLTSSDTSISLVVGDVKTSQAKNVDRYTSSSNPFTVVNYSTC